MARTDRCPRCGAELAGTGDSGALCTGCLLLLGLGSIPADELGEAGSEADGTFPKPGDDDRRLQPPSPSIPPALAVAGFRILRPLGEGGMGTVYLAEEEALGRRVALKLVSPSFTGRKEDEARARFLREARTMAAVEHPHIVRVYRIGRAADGSDYLAMEYVDGETLAARIDRLGPLPPAEALTLSRQTVTALAAAWDEGVIHRDIKPANLFVDRNGRVRVGDFGLARPIDLGAERELTHAGTMMGTPDYVSPEQARGEATDFRSDVYSLGIVLYEMLVGEPPFGDSSPFETVYRHLNEELPPVTRRRTGVPPEVSTLLRWMTAKDPAQRPASYEDLLAALEPVLARLEASAAPTKTLPPHLASVLAAAALDTSFPLGPLVAKRCDRLRQMMAFARQFREQLHARPGQPQIYLVHGEEGQCHQSLVERFAHEQVSKAMEEHTSGLGGGVLVQRLGWPYGASLSELETYLVTELFTLLDASYAGVDASAAALARLDRLALTPAVILQHEIRTGSLDRHALALVDWYVNDFWAGLEPCSSTPLFLVFLNVIYSRPHPRRRWLELVSPSFVGRKQVERRLREIFAPRADGVPRLALSELEPVTVDHVKEWFSLNNVYDTEKERRRLAEGIFTAPSGATAPNLPMEEIEPALRRIHDDFLRRKGHAL